MRAIATLDDSTTNQVHLLIPSRGGRFVDSSAYDNWLMHVAAALGKPVYVLESGFPDRADRVRPWVIAAAVRSMHEAIRRGVLIVQSRRSPGGRLRMRTKDLDTGIVLADNLNPQKARVLAMVALATTRENDEIRRMFEEY